jgi:hypothetical protein
MCVQSQRQGRKVEKPSEQMRSTSPDAAARKRLNQKEGEASFTDRLSVELENYLSETAPAGSHYAAADDGGGGTRARTASMTKINFDEEQDEEDTGMRIWGCRVPKTCLGIKSNTIVRMLKVCSAFPFVIVVAALNFSNKYAFLRYVSYIVRTSYCAQTVFVFWSV